MTRPPLWKGKPEHQLQKLANLFAGVRANSLELARHNRRLADEAEHNLIRIGFGDSVFLETLTAGDPVVFGLEVRP